MQLSRLILKLLDYFSPDRANRYRVFRALISNRNSYLYSSGWMRSFLAGKPVSKGGEPVPWMNYPVVSLLGERLTAEMTLFEYGSGFSTQFWASRVREVVSVEYDRNWYDLIVTELPSNARVIFQEQDVNGEYCRTIFRDNREYDIVVVDGRDRVNCIKSAFMSIGETGVVILDDSQRERYNEAFALAKNKGYKAISIEGLKPGGSGVDRSTIFYKEGNCLGI